MVGGHLFRLLALVMHLSKTQFGSAFGSRERRAIMGYREMLRLDLFPFDSPVSRHSVTGTPRYTTKYANYANIPSLERASMPPTRGTSKEILCSPYYLLNLSLSPLSQINSYPRKTSHLLVS